jgi:hypothetical protein
MRRRVSLLVTAVLVVGCGTTPNPSPTTVPVVSPAPSTSVEPAPSGPAATFSPAAARPRVPFAGLYITPDLSVTGDDTSVVIHSAQPCSYLADLVEAGEWRVATRATAADVLGGGGSPVMTVLALERGDETALAWLAGGDSCTARITRTTMASLRISGAATFDGQAAYDQALCVPTDRAIALLATYRPTGGPAVEIGVSAPVRLGSSTIDPEDVEVYVARRPVGIGDLAATLVQRFEDVDRGFFPEAYAADHAPRVVIDVATINPFSGTLRVSGFGGDRGAIELEASVSCHLPGGALDRVAEAIAVPTAEPGATAPTVDGITPAPPRTIVAVGGPLAGTYPAGSDWICARDDDLGAWVTTYIYPDGTLFYLMLVVPLGGGETDVVHMGLAPGDGTEEDVARVDTTELPPVGVGHGRVSIAGGTITMVAAGRTPDGVTLAANLTCTPES